MPGAAVGVKERAHALWQNEYLLSDRRLKKVTENRELICLFNV